jgi:predicted TIM-barrel fold metal-dependent hydrolase
VSPPVPPAAPARGWDCHAHLFGPYARFPLAGQRSYTPPEAIQEEYLALLTRLGLSHGVLVQPSAYGEDHSLLLHALAARPGLRGVIVTRPGGSPALEGLRQRGVRAARFSHRSGAGSNFAGSASFDDLLQLATPLANAGLHAELWTDCAAFADIAARVARLPVPVVVDHMGGFDAGAGVEQPGFRSLLSLLARGKVHVKLCAYRNLLGEPDLGAGRPFHQALVRANPAGLVWGSDWPHLRVVPAPDALALLRTFRQWTGDSGLIEQILVTNPAALYD